MNKRTKLISLLQTAHAAEHGAARAYMEHKHKMREEYEREEVNNIYKDELDHIRACQEMLDILGAKTVRWKVELYYFLGWLAGMLCYIFPLKYAHKGAQLMEHIGVVNYTQMANLAEEIGYPEIAEELSVMADTEIAHQEYFEFKLSFL